MTFVDALFLVKTTFSSPESSSHILARIVFITLEHHLNVHDINDRV